MLGARFLPGEASEDMRALPPPDFDGMPLDKYLSPVLTLPYDPTRGCYWGKCTFCHYGLAEVGTASYRERSVETCVAHLASLSARYGTRHFYLSQDSVAPKTIVKLAGAMADAGLDLRWATDLKPERYLTSERAETLRRGGAVACALGVESASPRVLGLIDKGAPVEVVSDVIGRLAAAGIAAEAMCFTGFPTETLADALTTLSFLDDRRDQVAAFLVGQFDLTHGALVAQAPERFGIREVWQVEGDTLGTGLFFEEETPPLGDDEPARLDEALEALSSGWLLRRYPWAGSLSTAHTVLYYDRHGRDVFRRLAAVVTGGVIGASTKSLQARFDLEAAAGALAREAEAWHHLVRVVRKVSREVYGAVTADFGSLPEAPRRYRVRAGAAPVAVRTAARGRRPPNSPNALSPHERAATPPDRGPWCRRRWAGGTAAARSSRVEDRDATVAPDEWHVRVPAHHDLRCLRTCHRRDLRAQLGAMNADVDQKHSQHRLRVAGAAHEIERQHVRQVGRTDVDVSANGEHGGDDRELREHPEISNVARVQDGVGRARRQVLGCLRVRLRVRVRHHREPERPLRPQGESPCRPRQSAHPGPSNFLPRPRTELR